MSTALRVITNYKMNLVKDLLSSAMRIINYKMNLVKDQAIVFRSHGLPKCPDGPGSVILGEHVLPQLVEVVIVLVATNDEHWVLLLAAKDGLIAQGFQCTDHTVLPCRNEGR